MSSLSRQCSIPTCIATTALLTLWALPAYGCMVAGGAPQTATHASTPANPGNAAPATDARYRMKPMSDAPARANQLLARLEARVDGNEASSNGDTARLTVDEATSTGLGGALGATPQPPGAPTPQPGPAKPKPQEPPADAANPADPAPPSKSGEAGKRKLKQALVVEGNLTFEVEEVPEAAQAIRAYIEGMGGRVMSEQMSGGARSWTGTLQLKLPPDRVDEFLAWLAKRGEIQNKNIRGTDVSRTLFDQQIALENLELTLARMRKLLDKEGLDMKDVLAIEREMTRLRGEIERIKGEKRFLEYRVAMATLHVYLRRRAGVILGRAKAKFYPGARLSTLFLLDADGRESMRVGGGVVVHTIPRLTLEVDIFPETGDEGRAVIATFGGATYSDFLGRGKRQFLNPYLGLRIGYGYLDGSAFVFAGGGGVELFKHEYFLLDASVNFVGFARKEFDATVTGALSAVVAF